MNFNLQPGMRIVHGDGFTGKIEGTVECTDFWPDNGVLREVALIAWDKSETPEQALTWIWSDMLTPWFSHHVEMPEVPVNAIIKPRLVV